MQNVTITTQKELRNYERDVKLNNGHLVVHYDKYHNPLGTYIVTSFRNNKDNPKWKNRTNSYCTLINLDNGTIAFEEPCSRTTTEKRVLSHLCNCCESAGYSSFHYNYDKIDGSYIKELPLGAYHTNIRM